MHIWQFVDLWSKTREVQFQEDVEDTIKWKHTTSGEYTAASAYKAQLVAFTPSPLKRTIWKTLAPPKVKFFAWLATQNRVWTADHLKKRGWPNCGLCPCAKESKNRSPTSSTNATSP